VHSSSKSAAQLAVLRRRAAELTSGLSTFPVQVRPICAELGIKVVRRSSVPSGKAYLAWNQGSTSEPLVLLATSGIIEWDRFCTAHEIGHFVLISTFHDTPSNNKDYWKTEALCDEFARELLTPGTMVETWLSLVPVKELSTYFDACMGLAHDARVPWVQAAKRIHAARAGVAFFRATKNQAGDYIIRHSSFADDKGRYTKFAVGSDGWKALDEEVQGAHDGRVSHRQVIDLEVFRKSSFEKLIESVGVREIIVEPAPQADVIKIVAGYQPA
jgi:hypothetical protein